MFSEIVAPVTDALLSLLAPAPGERILELAAGPGGVGSQVAPLVGSSGSVLVTDFSPGMVEAARARGAELKLANVEFAVVDGQEMPFAEASFDGVVCRFGYMLMPSPVAGLSETRRVLGDGGRVAFAVWGDRRLNAWGTAAPRALVELGHLERPDPYGPGPFALDEADRLKAAVTAGGLEIHHVEDVEVVWRYPDTDAWWTTMLDLSSVMQEALSRLSDDEAAAVRARAEEHAGLHDEAGAVAVGGIARVVLAHPR
jgi:SAM-dependent methyltransferase